jgi:hypothetical protein
MRTAVPYKTPSCPLPLQPQAVTGGVYKVLHKKGTFVSRLRLGWYNIAESSCLILSTRSYFDGERRVLNLIVEPRPQNERTRHNDLPPKNGASVNVRLVT